MAKSFAGNPPPPPDEVTWSEKHMDVEVVSGHRGRRVIFKVLVPVIDPEGKTYTLQAQFLDDQDRPRGFFALGLLIVGAVSALLVYPFSRLITKPLSRLRDSALAIAEGDLSCRAEPASGHEIGDLVRAFNHMADRVEGMVRSGRELTANVSHELRSPLARIRLAEELIGECLDQDDQDRARRYLQDIRREIEDMDALIGRSLDLSKLDLYESESRPQKIDLADKLQASLDKFHAALDRVGLEPDIRLPPGMTVTADPEALGTVLDNILDNAVKHAGASGILSIWASNNGPNVEIVFSNPVPDRTIDTDRIFEPFHRRRSDSAGTGLGLSIVRRIAEKHKGSAWAVHRPGEFVLTLALPR